MNLYAYCTNNPINYLDPWGWCKDKTWGQYYRESLTRGLISSPPVVGFSLTLFGITASLNTNGIEFLYSFFTLVGISVDAISWNPTSNYELTLGAGKHASLGIFPADEGTPGVTSPISAHAGTSTGTFTTINESLIKVDWEGNLSGTIYDAYRSYSQ